MSAQPPGLRPEAADCLLRVEGLRKAFLSGGSRARRQRPREVTAVDGLSFDVLRGETFGLVGESGCGKSTVARCVLRLIEPSAGTVIFDGKDILALDASDLRRLRRRMQIVFQETTASLDSRMSVRAIVQEPLEIHGIGSRPEQWRRVDEILELVGIRPAEASRKPHAFSGGQRQRIGVARALVLNPDLVVLDEPVSAVDVSIQAQILNLFHGLQNRLRLTYLFIVHDLAVAEHFCDRLAVLYLGSAMELGSREALFRRPLHPYTVSLLSAVPIPDPAIEARRRRIILRGEASPIGVRGHGCPFRTRCPIGWDREICKAERPPLSEREPDHWVACHFPGELTTNEATRASYRSVDHDAEGDPI
jgi:oligopeptide/dipeptide ABC transporter ATP-binding protein